MNLKSTALALLVGAALGLPAWAETQVRNLLNDSDAPVTVELVPAGEKPAPVTIEKYAEGTMELTIPEGPPDGPAALKVTTRAGVLWLVDSEGQIMARPGDGQPCALSSRSGEYITLYVAPDGKLRVRRWDLWYGR